MPGFVLANPGVFGYYEKKRFEALRRKRFCRSFEMLFYFPQGGYYYD